MEYSYRNNKCGTLHTVIDLGEDSSRSLSYACPFFDVEDVSAMTPEERMSHGAGYAPRRACFCAHRRSVFRCVTGRLACSFVVLALSPPKLSDTNIFLSASSHVLLVIEDDNLINSHGAPDLVFNVDGLKADDSIMIAALAGTSPGVVENVDASVVASMLRRAGKLRTSKVPLCARVMFATLCLCRWCYDPRLLSSVILL
jgi:hypothetical protein